MGDEFEDKVESKELERMALATENDPKDVQAIQEPWESDNEDS